ncbi:CMRF35-like molecule 9 isoform X10 [Manis javanica]|uniref:CMRF35-like molecule 9 isoform X10 n=1 Tax=Manis javanica TaxID=9974 RepID=UPI003C6D92E9
MQPLTLLWGCLLIPGCRALMGPKEIRGFEGDTVSLQCIYKEELRTYKKYWCRRRGFLFSRCSGAIYVEGDGQERTEGRVSIQDRPQELTLKVTLRNLTLQDAGNYFCGVKKLGPDETFMVSLLIFPGTSRPASPLDPTSAGDAGVVPSSSSKSRVHVPMIRILAPVLVLLTLLLAAGLAALGSCVFRWRKEAQLATEAQRNKKVQLSHLTSEEDEAPSPDLEGDMFPGPPPHISDEKLDFSKFISV